MSKTKNSVFYYILTIPFGYFLLKHIHHTLLPFNIVQRNACQNTSQLLETYSAPGFHELLDRIVCVLVRFCYKAVNDPLCFPITATLVGLATTAYAIMSVERVRFNNTKFLTTFMIAMGNVIGTGIIAPLAWLPWYGWTLHSHYKSINKAKLADTQTAVHVKTNKKTSKSLRQRIYEYHEKESLTLPFVQPHHALGIALACLVGQFLPVALLVSHGPSLTQRNILAAFQYFPITFGLVECGLPLMTKFIFKNTDEKKKREEGKESVKLLYASLASVNAFIWMWVWIKWFQTAQVPEQMLRQWIELFFSFGTGSNSVAYMLMWDVAALLGTFTYWSWLEDGKKGVQCLLLSSVVLGPGAGLALYSLKREHRI